MSEESKELVVLTEEQKKEVVQHIVHKWNDLVTGVENVTIQLCLMIQDIMKDYPKETIKDILDRVKQHPDIKRFVSIDRIWQGMRLVKHRPEIIEFAGKAPEEQKYTPLEKKPYLKKDGGIFWEFYFELEKAPLPPLRREMLEIEGKKEKWSFRQLRQKIQEVKEDLSEPTLDINKKQKRAEYIREVCGVVRRLSLEKLVDAKKLLIALEKQNLEEIREVAEGGKEHE